MDLVLGVCLCTLHVNTIQRYGENGKRFRWYLNKAFISDGIRLTRQSLWKDRTQSGIILFEGKGNRVYRVNREQLSWNK